MRILFFLTFFFTFNTYAQLNTGTGVVNCVDADFSFPNPDTGNYYECNNVTITNLTTAALVNSNFILRIRAQGTVTITNISFEGQNGAAFGLGGLGGSGAGAGGTSFGVGSPSNGDPAVQGGLAGTSGNCFAGTDDAEAGGGGGGVLLSAAPANTGDGEPGIIFAVGGVPGLGAAAGTILGAFDEDTFTLAGAGGGSGDFGCDNNVTGGQDPGGGGGGGGGLHIVAAGNVTINGIVNAFGGDGGAGTLLGSGGGGGSGGALVIQTLGQINVNGATMNADGGNRGLAGTNARGGIGGPGIIIFEDADGTVDTTLAVISPTPIIRPVSVTDAEAYKLTSDISCGIVSDKDKNKDFFYQMSFGFLLAVILAGLSKILFRPRMKI